MIYSIKRQKNSSVIYKFTSIFLMTMIFIAFAFAGTSIYSSAKQYRNVKIGNMERSLQTAVNDLENQYDVLRSISTEVAVSIDYRPFMLQSNPYQDIVLLEKFSLFANYSPICSSYFLFYEDSEKLYTNSENVSYFPFYMAELGLSSQEIVSLYEALNGMAYEKQFVFGNKCLLAFPVRFRNSLLKPDKATMVFIVEGRQLVNRCWQISEEFPHQYQLLLNGELVAGSVPEGLGRSAQAIQVEGNSRLFSITAFPQGNLWSDILEIIGNGFYPILLFGVALCVVMAVLLARTSISPVKKILEKYEGDSYNKKNEFLMLENILGSMEKSHDISVRQIRRQLIIDILRGYYPNSVQQKCDAFNVTLDKPLSCVFVIDAKNMTEERMEKMADSAEGCALEQVNVCAAALPDDQIVAIIANYLEYEQTESVLESVNRALAPHGVTVYAGNTCEGIHKISLSYIQALTFMHESRQAVNKKSLDIHIAAAQMVEAARQKDDIRLYNISQNLCSTAESSYQSALLMKQLGYELVSETIKQCELCGTVLDKKQASEILLIQDFLLQVEELRSMLIKTFGKEKENKVSKNTYLTPSILADIHENVGECDFSLAILSEKYNLSTDYISSLIKNATGKPFKEYLTSLRLEKAEFLLRNSTDMSINDISSACGYRKAAGFIKKFREVYGYTPTQFR